MLKGKMLCSQGKVIVNRVYDYFERLEKHSVGQGALKRMLEVTG